MKFSNKIYSKAVFLLIFVGILYACDDPKPNDLLPERDVNVVVDINLPLYQDLLIPSGYAFTPVTAEFGLQGIVIVNLNSRYVAFDRACPHMALNDCSPMSFNYPLLKCNCDNATFNLLDGGTSSDVDFQAREYHVEVINGSQLRITNY